MYEEMEDIYHFDGYYPDYKDEFVHVNELTKYENAAEYVEEIVKHVYLTGDVRELEKQLEELAHVFHLQIPDGSPKI